ncbi:dynein regulation protein LC7 [Streptomyces spinoverrucosus]|uniref:Dynein regulation protein LC7 n=1 Tax=Streptomyces spinoverrucosus TaxID=284043 RepID=A0A4Y3VV55_9ACTN|nr:roadblock/LC7 domain-containing protein [Streptomyces spinoverrucosus]GEC09550.1 dynein regulation protein LC7 [Streptomyces spinoverrucosus]GHB95896.1 dynein regulation protein LC7 [Streptomyces spinoverrucosus]
MRRHAATPAQHGAAGELDWLITSFVTETAHVSEAAVVSCDGLLLAHHSPGPATRHDQLAALTCGIAALAAGGAELLRRGRVRQSLVEMRGGSLLVASLPPNALLAVLAGHDCDMSLLGYQTRRLIRRAGAVLSPSARTGWACSPSPGSGPRQIQGTAARPRRKDSP